MADSKIDSVKHTKLLDSHVNQSDGAIAFMQFADMQLDQSSEINFF